MAYWSAGGGAFLEAADVIAALKGRTITDVDISEMRVSENGEETDRLDYAMTITVDKPFTVTPEWGGDEGESYEARQVEIVVMVDGASHRENGELSFEAPDAPLPRRLQG